MLEISVRFLGGEFVARSSSGEAEWPPHPARLFYALAAAWFEGGRSVEGREALHWLEGQEPPAIVAPQQVGVEEYGSWVPVNSVPNTAKDALPKGVLPRASCFVGDEPVAFVWDRDPPSTIKAGLWSLARDCTRLGSSESLVSVGIGSRDDLFVGAWRPARTGIVLRVPAAGTLEGLTALSEAWPGRVLPCAWAGYRWAHGDRPGRLLTVGLTQGTWPVERTAALGEQLRRALLALAETHGIEARPLLHGHADHGGPLQQEHLRLCGLPDVGYRHASGGLLGLAVVLPASADSEDLDYAQRLISIWLSNGGRLRMSRHRELVFGPADARMGLQEARWSSASAIWQTAVPLELPRHVVKRRGWDDATWRRAREGVLRACEHVTLPRPVGVEVSHTPFALGSPHVRSMEWARRPLVHARLEFAEPVEGPLLLGGGRYVGLGLMMPVGVSR